ncbi:MAG: response regulator [Nitrospirae bacterium]|uniref:response regulator n=1 Tax=Candidatus Magnetominusculus dajiuhuensis TaxID=3137712 RepID=UPI001A0981CC|nr:response regulator [Nitrospirota bacterium]
MAQQLNASILIVDDEEQFLEMLSKRLQARGLRIDSSTHGADALRKINEKDFDAIVLDLSMPGMDGMEVLQRIKHDNPELQVIILTGHATLEKSVEAMKGGAVDFMEKPVDMNLLLEKIGGAKNKKAVIVDEKLRQKIQGIIETRGW